MAVCCLTELETDLNHYEQQQKNSNHAGLQVFGDELSGLTVQKRTGFRESG